MEKIYFLAKDLEDQSLYHGLFNNYWSRDLLLWLDFIHLSNKRMKYRHNDLVIAIPQEVMN